MGGQHDLRVTVAVQVACQDPGDGILADHLLPDDLDGTLPRLRLPARRNLAILVSEEGLQTAVAVHIGRGDGTAATDASPQVALPPLAQISEVDDGPAKVGVSSQKLLLPIPCDIGCVDGTRLVLGDDLPRPAP